jgi:hypothetical protein
LVRSSWFRMPRNTMACPVSSLKNLGNSSRIKSQSAPAQKSKQRLSIVTPEYQI